MSTLVSYPMQSALCGNLTVPGDKSISHRSLLLGAIAKGRTAVSGFLNSSDCRATMEALQALGVLIEGPVNGELLIHGVGKQGLKAPTKVIDCGNSGTSMRLLAGLLAAQPFDSCLTGDGSLLQRPMQRIELPLKQMGANIETKQGCAPIQIRATKGLVGIDYQIPVASAQVKSCLLLAGLYAKGQTRISEIAKTRDHTELMLQTMGYPLRQENNTLIIDSQGECQAQPITIPGDLSSAAFFIVAATLIPGSAICIKGVGVNAGRTGLLSILKAMGADIRMENVRAYGKEAVADLTVRYAPLQGITIPLDLIPSAIDEFPIIAIAAAASSGRTVLRGAQELRFKESDRIATLVAGLQQLAIQAEELEDGFCIQGGQFQGGKVDSAGDHRVAMSFAIAGCLAKGAVSITNCHNIATSFPSFINTAKNLQLHLEELDYA